MAMLARALLVVSTLSLGVGCTRPGGDLLVEHERRGEAALAEGKYVTAITAFSHARELAPNDPGVQRGLMKARAFAIAERASRLAPESVEEARYEAQLLLDTDKGNAAAYLTTLANVQLRQGDTKGAKAKLEEALKADPKSWLAHAALGALLMARKETAAQAKGELEAALAARPGEPAVLSGLGQLAVATGDVAGGTEKLEAALEGGDDFNARMALGNARLGQQKVEEAILHFQRASQLDPKSAEAMSALGQALLSAGKNEEAERSLRAALHLRWEIGAATALGFALVRQRRSEAALVAFNQVLAEDPQSGPGLYGAGLANEQLGRPLVALELYQKIAALENTPQGKALGSLLTEAKSRIPVLAPKVPMPAEAAPAGSAKAPVGPPPPTR